VTVNNAKQETDTSIIDGTVLVNMLKPEGHLVNTLISCLFQMSNRTNIMLNKSTLFGTNISITV
jgi:hypothetical protein